MKPAQEIVASRFDSTSGTSDVTEQLTTNAYMDRSPDMAASGNKAVAVWIANTANSLTGELFGGKPVAVFCL